MYARQPTVALNGNSELGCQYVGPLRLLDSPSSEFRSRPTDLMLVLQTSPVSSIFWEPKLRTFRIGFSSLTQPTQWVSTRLFLKQSMKLISS